MKWNDSLWAGILTGPLVLVGCTANSASFRNVIPKLDPIRLEKNQPFNAEPVRRNSLANTAKVPVHLASHQLSASFGSDASSCPDAVVKVVADLNPMLETADPNQPLQAQTMQDGVPINLPTALAMIGGQHPVVGFARWRVKEAYAQLDRANALWLPTIQSGIAFRRRDGNYQAVDGSIVDVNLNSMNVGLGAGAVAAGSPPQPGISARFHLADAVFQPKAAEKTASARNHAASATLHLQLLQGAVGYIELLEAFQDRRILSESVERFGYLAKITRDYADVGQGLKSDADRAATEASLSRSRELGACERQLIASTRLARVLSIPMTSNLQPQDALVVPLELLANASDEASLIATGLATRPELKESQALVEAAFQAYQREKYAPFVPSLLLGFSTSQFGGGLGSSPENFGGRYDLDAMAMWETRNSGFTEGAIRKERTAQIQQANFAKIRVMDQVAQEVAEANVQINIRRQQLEIAKTAISDARASYDQNIDRIRDGQGLPIEALQSIHALETSQRAYLTAVSNFNRAQIQLQWALGWPLESLVTNGL